MSVNIAIAAREFMLSGALAATLKKYSFIDHADVFRTADELLKHMARSMTDVLLIDSFIAGANGMDVIADAKRIHKDVKAIVLLPGSGVPLIRQARRYGVNGFLTRESTIEELLSAIDKVLKGGFYVNDRLEEMLIRNIFTENEISYKISAREMDVLKLVCLGKTSKEIAQELGLSLFTVQGYQKKLMKKLQLKRSSELIVFAMLNGLV